MKNNVYKTATLVTGLSVAERALGFLYRIVLSRLIGAEGLGLYQIALSVFSVFLTVGTGGIPVTVSRLISKSKAENDRKTESAAVSAGLLVSLSLTLPVCLAFLLFKNGFSFLFSDIRSRDIFGVLLLGLVCTSLYAVVRGSFWGNKKFLVTSVLEIFEEAVMVVAGVLLLQRVSSPFQGAMKAAVAVIVSYFISFLASIVCFFLHKGRLAAPKGQLKPLFSAALPITAVRAGTSLIGSAVAVILPAVLIGTGLSNSDALELYGIVSGMVLPVLFVPSTVIGSISLVLVPELSEDYYAKRLKRLSKNVERGIFSSVVVACFLIPLFFVLGKDLGRLLYANELAGEMIEKCCFILLPMSLTMITTGILNSMNFEKQTLFYYFIGAALLIGAIFLLPAKIGVYAYPAGLGASYVLCAVCNLVFLCKKCPLSPALAKKCLTVFALVLPSSIVGKFVLRPLGVFFSAAIALPLAAVVTSVFTLLCYLLCQILPAWKTNGAISKKNGN